MKPWTNPSFQVTCYLCGSRGWNTHADDEWFGTAFHCSGGCDPKRVERYQTEKLLKSLNKQIERSTIVEAGLGI